MNFHVVTEMVGGSSDNGNLKTFLECIKNGPTRFVFIFQVVWFWNPILEIFFGNVQNIKLICYLETLSRKSKISNSVRNCYFKIEFCILMWCMYFFWKSNRVIPKKFVFETRLWNREIPWYEYYERRFFLNCTSICN